MTSLPALIEKLRDLKGPDREVDIAIVKALYPFIGECSPLCADDEPIFWREPFYKQPCPPLTASLDAVTALIERDGYQWLREHQDSMTAYKPWGRRFSASGANNSIALLIAFLEAKMEIEE